MKPLKKIYVYPAILSAVIFTGCFGSNKEDTSSGTLGAWSYASNTFTSARHAYASAVYSVYVYILGGSSDSGYLNDVQYAEVY